MDLLINFPQAALSLAEMMVNDEKSLLLFLRTFQANAACAKFSCFLFFYFIKDYSRTTLAHKTQNR